MLTVYICFLAGGTVLPLISFLSGFVHNLIDADVDTDIDASTEFDVNTDMDIDADLDVSPDAGMDTDMDVDSEIGIDTDTGIDIDAGIDLAIAFYPTSLMSLTTLAIVFGAVGSVMTLNGKSTVFTFIIAALCGYIASITVQTIIKTLKKVQTRNSGINENELMLYDGTVVDTILPGQLGSVSFVTLSNIRVSYPAKCSDESLRLAAGRVVKVKEIINGIFIVEPKNKYE